MIEVEGLTKEFNSASRDSRPAVEDLNFVVKPGEVFGLLGPNGAGKTTTLRMLCTVLTPSAGGATIAGYDVATQPGKVRENVGFLSANTGVYERMTAWEMVEYYGKLYGLRGETLHARVSELMDRFQMNDFRNLTGAKMSTGMKQKVSISRALVHNPPVLIFDEPTNGLDILVQRAVIQNISDLRGQGKTILFSTHIMSEVQKLCDRVAIMAKGRIVACGTLDELRAESGIADLEDMFFHYVGEPIAK